MHERLARTAQNRVTRLLHELVRRAVERIIPSAAALAARQAVHRLHQATALHRIGIRVPRLGADPALAEHPRLRNRIVSVFRPVLVPARILDDEVHVRVCLSSRTNDRSPGDLLHQFAAEHPPVLQHPLLLQRLAPFAAVVARREEKVVDNDRIEDLRRTGRLFRQPRLRLRIAPAHDKRRLASRRRVVQLRRRDHAADLEARRTERVALLFQELRLHPLGVTVALKPQLGDMVLAKPLNRPRAACRRIQLLVAARHLAAHGEDVRTVRDHGLRFATLRLGLGHRQLAPQRKDHHGHRANHDHRHQRPEQLHHHSLHCEVLYQITMRTVLGRSTPLSRS